MSESPAASERPGENGPGRTGTGSAPAESGTPDAAGSERAEAEGTREVSTSEEHGTTGTATRDASELPGAVASDADPSAADSPEAVAEQGSGERDADPAGPAKTGAAKDTARRVKALPKSLTFQLTRTSLLAVLAVAIGVTPIAFAQPFPLLLPSYLIPLALAYVIVRPRTVVTAERIASRGLFATARFDWDELASVRLDENRWVRAVLTSGKEVVLPAIRVRDLPRLAELSGGRLPDPNAEPAQPATDEDRTGDATGETPAAADQQSETDAAPAESSESDDDGRTGPKSAD
ncbi:PH domain-containing protein [Saccharopolyspora sp. NFXS83]|uniref:PH domain-containing protein n=1 Tax=Saccharopolyspora sp. NFXS83 TaxID=2993560 RepID=UPI00224A8A0B|nr:PH domain-containing protein [Saccharopolyspora sp. NFXS83]MCX2733946.1 PH domain-containing protein [Saccharopolyspora sp. NFXS83]